MTRFSLMAVLSFVCISCGTESAPTEIVDVIPTVNNGSVSTSSSALRVTFSFEKTVWDRKEPLTAKLSFENLSDDPVKLLSASDFRMIEIDEDKNANARKVTIYSPISLAKAYDDRLSGCQNDLTPDRIEKTGGIGPAGYSLVLGSREKKEFSFDLSKTCWQRSISSAYPDAKLASLVSPGKYRIYFETSFDTGKIIDTPDRFDANPIKRAETEDQVIEIK